MMSCYVCKIKTRTPSNPGLIKVKLILRRDERGSVWAFIPIWVCDTENGCDCLEKIFITRDVELWQDECRTYTSGEQYLSTRFDCCIRPAVA